MQERCKEEGVDCEFYAPQLLACFPQSLHDMKTYYTRGRRRYYHNEYVLEIENLNNITSVKSWIEANEYHKQNLKYLVALIELEEEGNQKITSEHISNKVQTGKRAVDKAIKKLEEQGLISIEGGRNRALSSTRLGQMCIRMNLGNIEDLVSSLIL